jgi:hypothetical protein
MLNINIKKYMSCIYLLCEIRMESDAFCRYRIEHSMKFNMLQNSDMNKEILTSKKIIYAVDIHRQAMKLVLK